MPSIFPGFLTRRQAADLLRVSPQRVSELAKRDGWQAVRVGRSWLYHEQDMGQTAAKMEAQKAWAILGIPRRYWRAWWLADMDEVDAFECPQCGEVAYSPAGDTKWSGAAACPSCRWREEPAT